MGLLSNLLKKLKSIHISPPEQPTRRKCPKCNNPPNDNSFSLEIDGHKYSFDESIYCEPCLKQYLEENSLVCAACGKLIFPGEPIAKHGRDYAHNTADCCEPGTFIGKLGIEGRKIVPHKS